MTTKPPRQLPARCRDDARAMLRRRLDILVETLESGAPDNVIANAAMLVGEVAERLDPWWVADRRAHLAERRARLRAGVCTDLDCEADATVGSLCPEHARDQMRAEVINIEGDDDDDLPS